jgi:predicted AlkP superfamily pyrophosphatase or phosphodiesterase
LIWVKKVLLIVVDACTSRALAPALESGRLPHLRELAEAGKLYLDCAAIFPSITPAATASIITGCYPF